MKINKNALEDHSFRFTNSGYRASVFSFFKPSLGFNIFFRDMQYFLLIFGLLDVYGLARYRASGFIYLSKLGADVFAAQT
jgi:hypothetical protein